MIETFEVFKDPTAKEVQEIPAEWSDDFMVYQIAGDVTKEDWVLDNFSYSQAVRWMLLNRYEGFATRESFKK